MPQRPIIRLPDHGLKRPAAPIEVVDAAAGALVDDLLATMRASGHSVGVAAPQIGVGLRAFVVDVTAHRKARSCHGEVALINPVIVARDGRDVGREGCMSVPDLTGDVERSTTVVVRGLTPDGDERVLECDAFEARAVQHEIDHLDGFLFLDRVVRKERIFRRKVYK